MRVHLARLEIHKVKKKVCDLGLTSLALSSHFGAGGIVLLFHYAHNTASLSSLLKVLFTPTALLAAAPFLLPLRRWKLPL